MGAPNLTDIKVRRADLIALGQEFGIHDIRIFGSVARNEAREGSDIDVLARVDRGRDLIDLMDFEERAAVMLGFPVEVVSEDHLPVRFEATVRATIVAL